MQVDDNSSVKGGCPAVKICGLTNLADAGVAVEAGARYLGFVFIERSKRHVRARELTSWWSELDQGAARVALFQNASSAEVDAVLSQIDLDVLQFHGDEAPEFCGQFGLPFWKSVGLPVGGSALGDSFSDVAQKFGAAEALVVDAVTVDASGRAVSGGTGKQFDWGLWPHWANEKLVLAGGLNPENIGAAVQALRPWAVDVSSGVEATPGRKDHEKVQKFCAGAMRGRQ